MLLKKAKKIAAVAMAAALMLQCGVTGLAEEGQVQETAAEAVQTQAAPEPPQTETVTEVPTEKAAESPQTEKATEAPTEKATEAPQSQAATEAPQTQAATEAAQTQAATEAPQTQAATEAPQTQAAAEAPGTEAEKKDQSEKKKKKKEEKTKLSERENDGKKMTSSELVSGLDKVLPYVFAAGQVEGPEDILKDQNLLEDEEGSQAVSSLEDFSVKLANGVSSSDVKILNIYADENGELDTAQLEKAFDGKTIDVTKQYCVVNVIADSPDQTLNFSGYEMVLSGKTVTYKDASQAGDIIYNFAAMDGEDYTDYKGTLILANGSGLQGTFLAPKASVLVQSDLAGSVYAAEVTVGESVSTLLQISFAMAREAEQSGTDAEAEEPLHTEAEGGNAGASDHETETIQEVSGELSSDLQEGTEDLQIDMQEETEVQTETAETEMEVVEVDTEAVETGTEAVEIPTETAETQTGEEELIVAQEDSAEEAVYYSGEPAQNLSVVLKDASTSNPVASGNVAVKAAADILTPEGAVAIKKGGEVAAPQSAADGADVNIGEKLQPLGRYYLEISALPSEYLGISRIYFSVNEQGETVIDSAGASQAVLSGGKMTVSLYKTTEAPDGSVVLSVVKQGSTDPVSGATFTVKNESGAVIRDGSGNPAYFIAYAGSPVILTGLAAGNYILSQLTTEAGYQIANDTPFTVTAASSTPVTVENAAESGAGITVSAGARYDKVVLTAAPGMKETFHVALFAGGSRVSQVKELIFAPDAKTSDPLYFGKLPAGTYQAVAVNEWGEVLTDLPYEVEASSSLVTVVESDTEKNAVLSFDYKTGSYPADDFYYYAQIALTKSVYGRDGNPLATEETFYLTLQDENSKTPENLYDSTGKGGTPGAVVTAFPLAFAMNNSAALTQNYYLKMTAAEKTYTLTETDAAGRDITADSGFAYAVTCQPESVITVSCSEEPGTGAAKVTRVTAENRLNDSLVSFRVVDEAGNNLPGAVLVLKNSSGSAIKVNGKDLYTSEASDTILKNALKDGNTYYLSEITAPDGYTPAADVEFTVKKGTLTEVVLVNKKTTATEYSITATKQVYAGKHQVYAYDNTSKTYAKSGAYTFYAALFSDAKCTKKVSNVQTITVEGLSGTTTFQNLKHGNTYYIAETTKYGIPRKNTSTLTIQYSDDGKIHLTEKNQTTTIMNVYSGLPQGYRYTGTLTLTKKVTDSTGAAVKVTDTFYAGIFRKSDYSDKPTVVKLSLENASSVSVKRRIVLSGSSDLTYYIAEVDASGNRLGDSSDFDYTITVDKPQATIAKSSNTSVTITNKQKTLSSKVTLYITKRVYDGSSPKKVNTTFYAGLFKDAQFTKAYTKPIALNLKNKSELTLKLSLNLGSAESANIYIAEVDADGKVIKDQKDFGYEVKMVNSTAAFTAEKREVQTILINSVYGSTSSGDWNDILSDDNNYMGGSGYVSDNGEASEYTGDPVKTGDNTPVLPALILMIAALAVTAECVYRRKKAR